MRTTGSSHSLGHRARNPGMGVVYHTWCTSLESWKLGFMKNPSGLHHKSHHRCMPRVVKKPLITNNTNQAKALFGANRNGHIHPSLWNGFGSIWTLLEPVCDLNCRYSSRIQSTGGAIRHKSISGGIGSSQNPCLESWFVTKIWICHVTKNHQVEGVRHKKPKKWGESSQIHAKPFVQRQVHASKRHQAEGAWWWWGCC